MVQVRKGAEGKTLHDIHRIINPTHIEKFYFRMMVEVIWVVINSTINPFIYLWRIKTFRDFFIGNKQQRNVVDVSSTTPSGMTVGKPAAPRSSRHGLSTSAVLIAPHMPSVTEGDKEPSDTTFENIICEEKDVKVPPAKAGVDDVSISEVNTDSEETFSPPPKWLDNSLDITYRPPIGWNDETPRTLQREKIWENFVACLANTSERPVYFRTRKPFKLVKRIRSQSI